MIPNGHLSRTLPGAIADSESVVYESIDIESARNLHRWVLRKVSYQLSTIDMNHDPHPHGQRTDHKVTAWKCSTCSMLVYSRLTPVLNYVKRTEHGLLDCEEYLTYKIHKS